MKLRRFCTRYRLQISYLFFGGLTTLVNYGCFGVLLHFCGPSAALAANVAAFFAATAFAYVTNKVWVFRQRGWQLRSVMREAASFLAARVFSFCLEEAGLFAAVHPLDAGSYTFCGINGIMVAKVLLSVIAVIMNYWVSRYWIFRKGRGDPS